MNKIQTLITLSAVALTATSYAQTIGNGSFETYTTDDKGTQYASEIGNGLTYKVNTIDSWSLKSADILKITTKGTPDPRNPKEEVKDVTNHSLRLYGNSTGGFSSAVQAFSINKAGKYTIAFQTFSENFESANAGARVGFFDKGLENKFYEDTFSEKNDGRITSRSFEVDLTEDALKKFGGSFALSFTNAGNTRDGENIRDVMIDNVSITSSPVPEPSSTALLGLGGLALLLRRRK